MDQLLIGKLMESVSMATTSLVSLVQLLDKVKNMVISDHIQHEASLKTLDSHYTIHRHMCPMQLLLWAKITLGQNRICRDIYVAVLFFFTSLGGVTYSMNDSLVKCNSGCGFSKHMDIELFW